MNAFYHIQEDMKYIQSVLSAINAYDMKLSVDEIVKLLQSIEEIKEKLIDLKREKEVGL